jgi:hypothetical protein
LIGAVTLISGIHNTANATQTVRELWDGWNGRPSFSMGGVVSNDVSTLGLDPSTTWVTSPPGNTSFCIDGTWNLDWEIGDGDTVLPPTANGNSGLFAYYGSDGNMESSLINPATGLPYGDYYSQCYVTRALTTNAYVNFQATGTYYFGVRFIGGGGYNWWSGDMAGGIGLAASDETNADFVGFGWTRQSPFLMADGVTDAGSSDYVTAGTLNQAGVSTHPSDSGGPYYPCAAGTIGALSSGGYGTGALLVGMLTTTTSGASTLSVKLYYPYANTDTDPNSIAWDATYSFMETNVMTQLLLWEYGSSGPCVQDAIRIGTTFADVIGLETIGAPSTSPSSTVYAGTTVNLTQNANLNTATYPMSVQWLSNNVPIVAATNVSTYSNPTFALSSTTTNFTADYSVAVSNFWGMITSAVTHVTVNPAVPPIIKGQPVSITRYFGSPAASFTVVVDGTPPFGLQWLHAGTNFQYVVSSVQTNTLILPPITRANAGNYSVTVTNLFGSTNSAVVALNEIVPAAGSYAAALTALSPWGYWRMDDNGYADPTIYDYFGWNNGVALDTNNMTFGSPGAPFIGWPSPHLATYIGNQWWAESYRLNLPQLPIYTTNMTFTMWVNNPGGGCQLLADNGYGNEYGLQNNNGDVQFSWGGFDSLGNKTNVLWNSGLAVPPNIWTFVALVVEPTQATVYVGTNQVSLDSVASGPILDVNGGSETNSDSTTLGDTASLTPLAVGRDPIPWAEESTPPSQWASQYGTWSDVAIFYQALTSQQITNLYLAGVGLWIQGTPDGAGNLILNWFPGYTLQQAANVAGPYTDIVGATAPYSVPLTGTPSHFYRIRQ